MHAYIYRSLSLEAGNVSDHLMDASWLAPSLPPGWDHQLPHVEQIILFSVPNLHHRSPESGALQCRSRESKDQICSRSGGTQGADHTRRPSPKLIKSPFPGPLFWLALAGIRRRAVQIKAIEKVGVILGR